MSALRLEWRRTWPDKPNDFVGKNPDAPGDYCRIYLEAGGPQNGQWYWTVGRDQLSAGTGFAPSKNEAARAAEAAYFRAARTAKAE